MATKVIIVKLEHPEKGVMYKKNKYTYDDSITWEIAQERNQFNGPEFDGISTEEEYLNQ